MKESYECLGKKRVEVAANGVDGGQGGSFSIEQVKITLTKKMTGE